MKASVRHLIYFLSLVLISCSSIGSSPRTQACFTTQHHEKIIPNIEVYVKFNTTEFPGYVDLDQFHMQLTSDANGRVCFNDIPLGNHWFVGIGYDEEIGRQGILIFDLISVICRWIKYSMSVRNNYLFYSQCWKMSILLVLCTVIMPRLDLSLIAQDLHDIENYRAWQEDRLAKLKANNGWLTVCGLFWLRSGHNTIGSDPSNTIVLPEGAPAFWGKIQWTPDKLEFTPSKQMQINANKVAMDLVADSQGKPTLITYKNWQFYIIQRQERVGVRLRDTLHAHRMNFDTIPYFQYNPDWIVKAKFTPAEHSDTIVINNVLGMSFNRHPVGRAEFSLAGQSHQLELFKSGDRLMCIFGDKTTGNDTYGGGRYLYLDYPLVNDNLVLDFNRAENPPCVFTNYATCLLPPKQNMLPIAIMAGELNLPH